jgi:hypothetical protein
MFKCRRVLKADVMTMTSIDFRSSMTRFALAAVPGFSHEVHRSEVTCHRVACVSKMLDPIQSGIVF